MKWKQSADASRPDYSAEDGDFLTECAKIPEIRARWPAIAGQTNPLPPKRRRHFQAALMDALVGAKRDMGVFDLVLKYFSIPQYRGYVLTAYYDWESNPDISVDDVGKLRAAYAALAKDKTATNFERKVAERAAERLADAMNRREERRKNGNSDQGGETQAVK